MGWKAIARSATGRLHRRQGLPCQDFGSYARLEDGTLLGAVADGAGSARFGGEGARLAVEATLEELGGLVAGGSVRTDVEARAMFEAALERARREIARRAEGLGAAPADLACTLLAVVAGPSWLAGMQVGDGITVARPDGEAYRLLFVPDKGEYPNETTFVTDADAAARLQTLIIPGRPVFVCLASDGLEPVAVRQGDWTAFGPFFGPLEEFLRTTADPEAEDAYLTGFLDSERLNRRTSDDKTLLVAVDA